MWLFTKIGFFSGTLANFKSKSYAAMPRPEHWETVPYIMVRARVKDDLTRLVEFMEPGFPGQVPEIFEMQGHDYPYRLLVTQEVWVRVVGALVADVDYSNFKSAVETNARTRAEGHARHDLYMKVWSVMHGAERWLRDRAKSWKAPGKDQGHFGFWERSERFQSDPRSDRDMQRLYSSRGWQEWLEEDEERAIVSDLPEGTHEVVFEEDIEDAVIDFPTNDDIARFEAAMSKPAPRRRRRGR